MSSEKGKPRELTEADNVRQILKDIIDGKKTRYGALSLHGQMAVIEIKKDNRDPLCEFLQELLSNRLQNTGMRKNGVKEVFENDAPDFLAGKFKGYLIYPSPDNSCVKFAMRSDVLNLLQTSLTPRGVVRV